MAETTSDGGTAKTAGKQAKDDSSNSAAAQVVGPRPLVINTRRKKKKKRYSRGLKELQQLERGTARSSQRLGRAVEKGLREYRRRSNRSARRRRDGSMRDFVKNWNRGLSDGLRVASNAPYDVVKPLSTRRISRQVRNSLRVVAPLFFR